MGQLGIVVEARLETVPQSAMMALSGPAPVAAVYDPQAIEQVAYSAHGSPTKAGKLFWFTLFVDESSLDAARVHLDSLERKHAEAFTFLARYTYFIAHRRITAPLIWPHAAPFYAVGSWGIVKDVTSSDASGVLAFDAQFTEMALAHGYRRYVQSEVPCGPGLYERCFGSEVYGSFRALKEQQDPHDLLNRGWVFNTRG
jgi:hypothetical protein